MSIQLLVLAGYEPTDPAGEEFRNALSLARETSTFKVRCCGKPSDLLDTVKAVAKETFQRIDVLDIYGHGSPGYQHLGPEVLFSHEDAKFDIATELSPLLTVDARVRLLGCTTGIGPNGRRLLLGLHQAFGGSVVVYGSVDFIQAGDPSQEFDAAGFKKTREETFLFSSTEAASRELANRDARDEELRAWVRTLSLDPGAP